LLVSVDDGAPDSVAFLAACTARGCFAPAAALSGTRYGAGRVTVGEDEQSGRVRRNGEHERRLPRKGWLPGVGLVVTVTVAGGGDRLA
jgi:hypothetical protein